MSIALGKHPTNIKGVNDRKGPVALILISGPLNLSHTISRKVDLVRKGQTLHGMEDIEHRGIAKHNRRLKKVEEPFLFENGANLTHAVNIGETETGLGEVLDCPVDGTDSDERATAIQDYQSALDFAVQHTGAGAIGVEFAGQRDESCHQHNLQD